MIHDMAKTFMIKQQLRTGNITDPRILNLFETFPREAFVPSSMQHFAYSDMRIPLNATECMLTPLEEASILQHLALTGQESVLEIGTGYGYLTALLSQLTRHIISVDIYSEFTHMAANNLKNFHCDNVSLITADGAMGWAEQGPYDVIIMTGSVRWIEKTLQLQVIPGGKLLAFVGILPLIQGRLYQLDHHGNWTYDALFETTLPYLHHTQQHHASQL